MFSKVPNSKLKAIIGWKLESPSKLELLCMVLNSQLFFIAAAILVFYNQMRKAVSWAVICTGEGMFVILSVLLLMRIDSKNKFLTNTWGWWMALIQLGISLMLTFTENGEGSFVAVCFLWMASSTQNVSPKTAAAMLIYGIIALLNSQVSGSPVISISISLSNIFLTLLIKGLVNCSQALNTAKGNSNTLSNLAKPSDRLAYTTNIRKSQVAARHSPRLFKVSQSVVPPEVSDRDVENSLHGNKI